MDSVQIPNSGHPGAPMGMADIAEVLYNDFMKHNPTNPNWADRDRFIMSNGHGSMLPYSVLHLTGYELGIDDLKAFRKLHSKTPGHPEYGYAPGIETTTGPLGQGIANAVGFALAEKVLAAQFNKDGHEIVDHNTYVFLGDGCLMEGISHEACSLAGSFGLGKMICFYDDNNISIDGNVDGWFVDDTPKRFEAYNWHVQSIDGHDPEAIKNATEAAIAETGKPSIICCKTVIGKGNYISYGVREFGMSAVMNGVTLHGGLLPYGATFLMFSEYARNALRMAALMKIQTIFVYTHDSIGLGEDGPTHQAVEQIPTLRMIPNMAVWRTCDAVETAVSWKMAIERKTGPSTLIYSRQNLAHQERSAEQIANIEKGGYILVDTDGTPDVIVIATGSEVDLAVKAAAESDKKVRVVSMPSVDAYEAQSDAYKESVLPSSVTARVAVEAAIMDGWWKYVGMKGKVIGMTTFGESAPAPELFEYFGITVDNVLKAINEVV
ncbi:UNVERIFIED_CONTAM: hypothetical protein GTU68_065368 [Idotea baltica]|nr:hypothetical protein [Idotea baltica]